MPLRSTPESDGNLYGAVTSSAHPTERRQSSGRMKRGFATKTDRFIGFPHTEQPTRRRVLRRIAGRAPATETIFTEKSGTEVPERRETERLREIQVTGLQTRSALFGYRSQPLRANGTDSVRRMIRTPREPRIASRQRRKRSDAGKETCILFGNSAFLIYFCSAFKEIKRSGEMGEWLKPTVC